MFKFLSKLSFLMCLLLCMSLSCNRIGLHSEVLPVDDMLAQQEQALVMQQLTAEMAARIDSVVEWCHKRLAFNGNVLVSYKGYPVYKKAVGYADFGTKDLLEEESVFQLASVSKQFTAVSVLMLYEQGKLYLDDDVRIYIPELPYEGITIRHLLNHTSGLPNYMWLVEHKWKNKGQAPYNNEVIELMAKHKMAVYFRPGSRFNYSNTGYCILASIVEKVSGQKFHAFTDQHIFQPLGMTNTFVYSRAIDAGTEGRLSGYQLYRKWRYRLIPETINDGTVGDKGVYSTITDLYKWDEGLKANKLISESTREEAFSRGLIRNRYNIDYGFGFRIKEKNGKKVVYHNGLWNGFRTSFIKYLDEDFTLIVLNNTNSQSKNTLVKKLETLMLKETGQEEILLASAEE